MSLMKYGMKGRTLMIAKFADLVVNETVTLSACVKSATPRKTRNQKDYLTLELFDGTESISGNYWDWRGTNIPEKNSVVKVNATVSEWQGTKQLNINTLASDKNLSSTDFAPQSAYDLELVWEATMKIIEGMSDNLIKGITKKLFIDNKHKWMTVPAAIKMHHAFVGGTLIHSRNVAITARSICSGYYEANEDLVIAGALLHDIGKLFCYSLNGVAIDITDEGKMFEHSVTGYNMVKLIGMEYVQDEVSEEKLNILLSIILSHHGKLEYGASVPPCCIEAHIVSVADGIDATIQQIIETSAKASDPKWTERIYGVGNWCHIRPEYMKKLFE